MMNHMTTERVRAIRYSENAEGTTYLVMAAHAGRRDRTGAKVHMATMTVWKTSGRATMSATNCSANGQLRGTLITGDASFGKVSCKRCGMGPEAAERREAKAEWIEVTR